MDRYIKDNIFKALVISICNVSPLPECRTKSPPDIIPSNKIPSGQYIIGQRNKIGQRIEKNFEESPQTKP